MILDEYGKLIDGATDVSAYVQNKKKCRTKFLDATDPIVVKAFYDVARMAEEELSEDNSHMYCEGECKSRLCNALHHLTEILGKKS